jgi:phosphoglycerol transferase
MTVESPRREWLYYVVAIGLSLGIFALLFEPWKADPRVPLVYTGDALVHISWIKNIVETGWYDANDRWGYPGGQDLRDFPSTDSLHHFTFRLLALATTDAFLLFNLFYLLTFPLTACTALFVLRRLGISPSTAIVVSLLYTFQPYHLMRTTHLLLNAFYLAPLACLLALRLYQDRPFFATGDDERAERRGESIAAAAVCVAIGGSGAYYAFFSCFFFGVAGLAGACTARRWRPLLRAGIVSAIVFTVFTASAANAIAHRINEPNADVPARQPADSEIYGLKIVQMLMPVPGHRTAVLRDFETSYNSVDTPLRNENTTAALGILGSIGLLVLLGRAVLLRSAVNRSTLDGLAVLALAALLLGTVGGFGATFSFLVSPWIRCYNRISIFIAFFALTAVALLLDSARQRLTATGWPRRLFCVAVFLVGGLALLDQTHRRLFPAPNAYRDAFEIDREFVRDLEARVPAHSAILQLPNCHYPEGVLPVDGNVYLGYEQLRPQLHSTTLRWTYGSMAGHAGYLWNCHLARMPRERQWIVLADAGFQGVCVDRNGYGKSAAATLAEIAADLRPAALTSRDGRLVYFDLASFAARLQPAANEEEHVRRRDLALNPVLVFFRNGFFEEQANAKTNEPYRWGRNAAEMEIRNDAREAQTVRLRWVVIVPEVHRDFTLTIQSDLFSETLAVGPAGTTFDRVVTVPPGRHRVRMSCDAPVQPAWQEPSKHGIVFRVTHFQCQDVLSEADEMRYCEETARLRAARRE